MMLNAASEAMPEQLDVVIVGGLGHVGLPFGLVLADAGLQVGLYDINSVHQDIVRKGKMPFMEHDAEELLDRVLDRTLHIVPTIEAIQEASVIVITIGTPIDEYMNANIEPLFALAEEMRAHLQPEQLVLLRSTVMPGVSRIVYDTLRRHVDIDFAYCPERVAQGFAIREIRELPQIVSGFSEQSIARARALFSRIGPNIIHLEVPEAELAKLFCNSWRYIQFAIANQFYILSTEQGMNFSRILEAMTHDYPRMRSFPRPGFAAGPCLMKDTMQLAAYSRQNFELGHAAMHVNEGLPAFIVDMLKQRYEVNLADASVGILGMAFKADADDIRDSLSFKLRKLLRLNGAKVLCSDEYISNRAFVTKEEIIEICDVIIIGVPHSAYRNLHIPENKTLIDLWSISRPDDRPVAG